MVVSLILGKKKRITNVKNKTMPYNNSPAKKHGKAKAKPVLEMNDKMKAAPKMMGEPSILKMCGSARHAKK